MSIDNDAWLDEHFPENAFVVDAGMAGNKLVCPPCKEAHYANRPAVPGNSDGACDECGVPFT